MKMGMNIPWVLETQEPYFSMMDRGEKTYDGRAPDVTSKPTHTEMGKNYKLISQFDSIHIQLVDASYKRVLTVPQLLFTVFNVTRYDSIKDALKRVNFKKLMPDVSSEEELLKKYFLSPNYEMRVRKSGFVVVELRKSFP